MISNNQQAGTTQKVTKKKDKHYRKFHVDLNQSVSNQPPQC